MQINTYRFEGKFNKIGRVEIAAPNVSEALDCFFGIDFGDGYGVPTANTIERVTNLGPDYVFDKDELDWLEAVKMGTIE